MASSIKYPLASLPKRLLYLCITTSRIFVMEFDLNHLMYVIKHEPHCNYIHKLMTSAPYHANI